ncbi:MAG TPA: M23 family metallopeptidase, partial [Rhodocyclaceae bacterium]|nr:M23 family metallopeptidase [Rhodocyclaceae bacterium]
VEVLAAAAGVVVGVRDGEPDVSIRDAPPAPNVHKEAGNGARIDHGDGWFTQYSHLRQGSLRVRRGQRVAAGEVLGLVGLSGQTEFPHLHFSVAFAGKNLDPFAPQASPACGATTAALWSPAARAQLAYQASGVLLGGFADRVLDQRELQRGDRFQGTLAATAPAIVFQAEAFGVRAGDVEEVVVSDPQRRPLVERRDTLLRDQAVRRVFLGKRRSAATWPAGEYVGRYTLRRGGEVVAEAVVPLVVTP